MLACPTLKSAQRLLAVVHIWRLRSQCSRWSKVLCTASTAAAKVKPYALRKAAALRRGWQGGGQQRMPSGAAAQAVAEVVVAPCQLFISALSRPHQAYHVTTAVCSGVCRRWHLAALFADEFIDIRCLIALGAAARGHDRGRQAPRGRCAGRLRRKKPIWSRCPCASSTSSTHGSAV